MSAGCPQAFAPLRKTRIRTLIRRFAPPSPTGRREKAHVRFWPLAAASVAWAPGNPPGLPVRAHGFFGLLRGPVRFHDGLQAVQGVPSSSDGAPTTLSIPRSKGRPSGGHSFFQVVPGSASWCVEEVCQLAPARITPQQFDAPVNVCRKGSPRLSEVQRPGRAERSAEIQP